MSILENIKIALSSLLTHKMRSILTMLGIIIGVGSVIAIVAIGQGGEAMLKSQLVGSGNTIELLYTPSEEEMQRDPNLLMSPFTQEDISDIETIPEVTNVVATSSEFGSIRYQENILEAYITGINQTYLDVNELDVASGRNLLSADFLGGSRTAVVSDSFGEELFDGDDPLGKVIRIQSQPVEIVGVLEKPTGFLSFGSNEVYIPWNTWRNTFNSEHIGQVTLQAETAEDLEEAGTKAADMLNRIHGTEEAYHVLNMEEIAAGIGQVTRIMTIIIGSIAGVSLLVGGIGVMNIMLVSVTERTREIGVRMSLGATRGQILVQFLIESVTLTLIGGTIGILLGGGVANIVSHFAGWPSLVSFPVIIGGLLFSMIIGIVFGILPANKASSLDPIESLRYE
ncbi:ABC transporter permease [Oceanobacillus halophilus]|uniref:FtsX-like permease family protein n=1 Tax=Oceanobacillus halophilus TaxID=930130 RepID=A0A494ZR63_9BACI|nr:ABC transporter permease [Oceanobacillus halophilus]RKQ28205.1 FtsX-like permease family protein [Oceanobacillus halophilus]